MRRFIWKVCSTAMWQDLLLKEHAFFPNSNIRLYEEIRKRNILTLFIHNHYSNQRFDSVEMSDARAAYKLTGNSDSERTPQDRGNFRNDDDMQGIGAL